MSKMINSLKHWSFFWNLHRFDFHKKRRPPMFFSWTHWEDIASWDGQWMGPWNGHILADRWFQNKPPLHQEKERWNKDTIKTASVVLQHNIEGSVNVLSFLLSYHKIWGISKWTLQPVKRWENQDNFAQHKTKHHAQTLNLFKLILFSPLNNMTGFKSCLNMFKPSPKAKAKKCKTTGPTAPVLVQPRC